MNTQAKKAEIWGALGQRGWALLGCAAVISTAACGANQGRPMSAPYNGGGESGYYEAKTSTSVPGQYEHSDRAASQPMPPPASAPSASAGATADSSGGERSGGWHDSESPAPSVIAKPEVRMPQPEERPGLATHWGETRTSVTHMTSFVRADWSTPLARTSLFYNDSQGAAAMSSWDGYVRTAIGSSNMASRGVVLSLLDETGRSMPGFIAGGRNYAIGESGRRYSIVLSNQTPARFEAVVSVDGLDVIDGKHASFDKRGYVLEPYGRLEIDGFRQSSNTVAAFRFGDVRGSYASRGVGDDRNVGVIGVALFQDQNQPRWPWNSDEIHRRRTADPFPGRYAQPPN